jgi:hypothetical protein
LGPVHPVNSGTAQHATSHTDIKHISPADSYPSPHLALRKYIFLLVADTIDARFLAPQPNKPADLLTSSTSHILHSFPIPTANNGHISLTIISKSASYVSLKKHCHFKVHEFNFCLKLYAGIYKIIVKQGNEM